MACVCLRPLSLDWRICFALSSCFFRALVLSFDYTCRHSADSPNRCIRHQWVFQSFIIPTSSWGPWVPRSDLASRVLWRVLQTCPHWRLLTMLSVSWFYYHFYRTNWDHPWKGDGGSFCILISLCIRAQIFGGSFSGDWGDTEHEWWVHPQWRFRI